MQKNEWLPGSGILGISPSIRSSKWVQRQQLTSPERNTRTTLGVAKGPRPCSNSKIDCPCRVCPTSHSTGITEIHGRERDDKSPRPPYLPDLARPYFFLFGYVKHGLRGQSFETPGELFSASEVIWMGLEKSTLHVVFLE
jgi:hypothetical protein